MDHESTKWAVVYQFHKPNVECFSNVDFVEFTYDNVAETVVPQLLEDYRSMVKVFQHAQDIEDVLNCEYF